MSKYDKTLGFSHFYRKTLCITSYEEFFFHKHHQASFTLRKVVRMAHVQEETDTTGG